MCKEPHVSYKDSCSFPHWRARWLLDVTKNLLNKLQLGFSEFFSQLGLDFVLMCLIFLSLVLARILVSQFIQNYCLGFLLSSAVISFHLHFSALSMFYNMAAKCQSLVLNVNQSDNKGYILHGDVIFPPTYFFIPAYVSSVYIHKIVTLAMNSETVWLGEKGWIGISDSFHLFLHILIFNTL